MNIGLDHLSGDPAIAPGVSQDVCLLASGVTKSFAGVPALRDGRIALRPGTVHALCGGNGAGKSTFLSILMGLQRRDAGSICLEGREVHFGSPHEALEAGIAIVMQELSPVPGMTVAENIFLGREPRHLGCVVDYRRLNRRASALLEKLGFRITATQRMSNLSLAETQLVEIAKALSRDSRIVIMDEPTSAIGQHETELLFAAIRRITQINKSVIYVTHRMSEVFELADDYTVFRDGAFVEAGQIKDIDRRHLVRQIIGRDLSSQFRARPATVNMVRGPAQTGLAESKELRNGGRRATAVAHPMLEVCDLECPGRFGRVGLKLHAGEILGIYGLLGSGRSEFLQALFGMEKGVRGEIRRNSVPVSVHAPRDAMDLGMAFVTEDRKASGLVLSMCVRDNLSLCSLAGLSSARCFINSRQELRAAQSMVERFHIKAASLRMLVSGMSGGNQQKVVLGRWFNTHPKILLLDEPTRGIDEGAKHEIYQFMTEFAATGGAVLMVSSEIDEVLGMADSVYVFRRGQPALFYDEIGSPTAKEDIMHMTST